MDIQYLFLVAIAALVAWGLYSRIQRLLDCTESQFLARRPGKEVPTWRLKTMKGLRIFGRIFFLAFVVMVLLLLAGKLD